MADDGVPPSPPASQLIECRNSAFLDFLRRTTIANDEFPGPSRHWELVCLDHVIDVVSTSEPVITLKADVTQPSIDGLPPRAEIETYPLTSLKVRSNLCET